MQFAGKKYAGTTHYFPTLPGAWRPTVHTPPQVGTGFHNTVIPIMGGGGNAPAWVFPKRPPNLPAVGVNALAAGPHAGLPVWDALGRRMAKQ